MDFLYAARMVTKLEVSYLVALIGYSLSQRFTNTRNDVILITRLIFLNGAHLNLKSMCKLV